MATVEHNTEKHTSDVGHHNQPTLVAYIMVWVALMVLLVATVGAAFVPMPVPYDTIVMLLIATVKTVLVVLIFMHVMYSSRLTRVFVVAMFFWFGILVVFTFADYTTRWMLPQTSGWVEEYRYDLPARPRE